MRKIISAILIVAFASLGVAPFASMAIAADAIAAGTLIKTADSSTLYYVGEDNKLYVFPNDKTYFSWFDNFEDVKVVSQEAFASYALGGNVYYKPGSLLVKTPTSLKVYAVGLNGELRWIENEQLAITYYGKNWNKMVDDIPEGFFTNYKFGKSIASEDEFNPDEEEEQAPTISHGRGLKAKERIRNRQADRTLKRCEFLKNSVNRLQARAERWGMAIPTLGDDYIATCVASSTPSSTDDEDEDKKITVCKAPLGNPSAAHTIRISRNALKNHFKQGYTLGPCEGDDDDDDDTTEDETAPAISSIAVNAGTTTAVVTWTTNEVSDSKVEFDNEYPFTNAGSVSNNNDVTSHSLLIEGLATSTTYHYVVSSEDVAGNKATSTHLTFTTKAIDTAAPVISSVAHDVASSSAIVTWTTNEPASSKVTARLFGSSATTSVESLNLVTSHSLALGNLVASTTYYYTVESVDAQGNKATEGEFNFTTDAQ